MKSQPSSIWITILAILAALPVIGKTNCLPNKDNNELKLRQELATSFGQRHRALKSGFLSIYIYEWEVQPDTQQGKREADNTHAILSRITNHVGHIPLFIEGQDEGAQYHDGFLALLDTLNIQCADTQSIRYWYEYMPTSVIQRLSRSSKSNELSVMYPMTDEWLYNGDCLIKYFPDLNRVHVSKPEGQNHLPYFQIHEIDPVFVDFSPIVENWPMGRYANLTRTDQDGLILETADTAKAATHFVKLDNHYYACDTRGASQDNAFVFYHAQRLYGKPNSGDHTVRLPRFSVKVDAGRNFINIKLYRITCHKIKDLDASEITIQVKPEPIITYASDEVEQAVGDINYYLVLHKIEEDATTEYTPSTRGNPSVLSEQLENEE